MSLKPKPADITLTLDAAFRIEFEFPLNEDGLLESGTQTFKKLPPSIEIEGVRWVLDSFSDDPSDSVIAAYERD